MVTGGSVLAGDVSSLVPDDGVVVSVAAEVAAVVVAGPDVSVATVPPPPTDSCSFLSEQAPAIRTQPTSAAPIRLRRRRVEVLVIPTRGSPLLTMCLFRPRVRAR